jgi:hypothetical protein
MTKKTFQGGEQNPMGSLKPIKLAPGEKLNEELVEATRIMNAGKPDFIVYTKRVRDTFGLTQTQITEKTRYFLAGFIEGEGSLSIAIKKNINGKFGFELDPMFSITQHINGIKHLYDALELFKTGRIRHKQGSNATMVFVIEPRLSLQEKVCPFYENYVYPYSSPVKKIRYQNFKKMLELFDEKAHLDKDRLIYEMLPLWDAMRMQQNYQGETFKTLEDAQNYARAFKKS